MSNLLIVFCSAIVGAAFFLYLFPQKARKYILLALSIAFFCYSGINSIYYVIGVIAVTYILSRLLEKYRKRWLLLISVLLIIGLLVVVKYLPAWIGNEVVIPLGLSYYTLMAVGYLVEVYRGKEQAEHNILCVAMFLTFFPQTLAGPIGRSKSLMKQWEDGILFDSTRITSGFVMMMIGLAEKVVLADTLDIVTSYIFNVDNHQQGLVLVAGIGLYALQIYFDFAGYSMIAIGGARMLGIELMKNFDAPYFSTSIQEFWRRWHISLSSWFRDFLYFPLGGSRVGMFRTCLNLVIVFVVSGIWHGTAVGFMVWGLLHGIYLVVGRLTKKARQKVRDRLSLDSHLVYRIFQQILVFVLVAIAFLPFRTSNFAELMTYINNLFVFNPEVFSNGNFLAMGITLNQYIVCGVFLIGISIMDKYNMNHDFFTKLAEKKFVLRLALYVILVLLILCAGIYGLSYSPANFIYGNF